MNTTKTAWMATILAAAIALPGLALAHGHDDEGDGWYDGHGKWHHEDHRHWRKHHHRAHAKAVVVVPGPVYVAPPAPVVTPVVPGIGVSLFVPLH